MSTIVMTATPRGPVQPPRPARYNHGVVIAGGGGAIVTVHHDNGLLIVTAIERHPVDITVVFNRVSELEHDVRVDDVTVDASGLGMALWAALGSPRHRRGWKLYDAIGRERQALVDGLVLAVHHDQLRFSAGLEEQGAMTKALSTYRREVRDDGQLGSELVVALCLAIRKPGSPRPRIWV